MQAVAVRLLCWFFSLIFLQIERFVPRLSYPIPSFFLLFFLQVEKFLPTLSELMVFFSKFLFQGQEIFCFEFLYQWFSFMVSYGVKNLFIWRAKLSNSLHSTEFVSKKKAIIIVYFAWIPHLSLGCIFSAITWQIQRVMTNTQIDWKITLYFSSVRNSLLLILHTYNSNTL